MDSASRDKAIPSNDGLMKQMDLADRRLHRHLAKFWALPLTYLGAVFVSLKSTPASELDSPSRMLPLSLALIGVVILVAMYAAYEGATRAIGDIRRIEQELDLQPSPINKPLQYVPYGILCLVGILYSLLCL